jgi:hypothetical protein
MADSAESAPAAANPAQARPKKSKSGVKKPRGKPVHPRTSEMVGNAIKSLKQRGDSLNLFIYLAVECTETDPIGNTAYNSSLLIFKAITAVV